MVQVLPSSYFQANFLTVRANATNDMVLQILNKCETFWYVLFLPIPYGFKSVSKMAKNVFSPEFLQTLSELGKQYTVEKLRKMRNFFVLMVFSDS